METSNGRICKFKGESRIPIDANPLDIPEEWIQRIEKYPDTSRIHDKGLEKQIDNMIIKYYLKKTNNAIIEVCGITKWYFVKRVEFLKKEGLIK